MKEQQTYIYPDANPNPIISVSAEGKVIYRNKAGEDLLHLLNHTSQYVPQDWHSAINRVLESNKVTEREYQGQQQFFSCLFVPVLESECVNIYGQDITHRKQTEIEIFRRNAQLTTLNSISQALTSTLDLQETLTLITDHITQLLGVAASSVALYDEVNEELWYAAASGEGSEFVLGKRLKFGQGITGQVAQLGEPVMVEDVSRDPHFMDKFDQKSGFITLSILGVPLKSKGQTIGVLTAINKNKGAFNDIDLDLLSSMAAPATTAIENAKLYEKAQLEIVERKRAEVALQETVKKLKQAYEKMSIYAEELAEEINERKRAQLALAQERSLLAQRVEERTRELSIANAELARAARLKDEFLANMSHELRTPLSAILGKSEVLQEKVHGPLNEQQIKSLQTIQESGYHLLSLINDILDLSKIEADKLELDIHLVAVNSVCQASLRLIKEDAYKKQIGINLTIDEQVKILRVDERRLKQILVNLLSNAVKFTPEEGRVSLEVKGDAENEVVHFVITDTGIGIALEHMGHLFKPFTQLDSSLSRQYVGTGLGLSLVYRMTKLHGGSISVTSEIGEGSQFTVSLPWRTEEQKHTRLTDIFREDKTPEPKENSTSTLDVPLKERPLILLVEDNEANIDTFRDYLQVKNYRVVVSRTGEEALERTKEDSPDLILMDVQMPGMDGLDVIRHLRTQEEFATIPIIATTALVMPGDRERCLEAGANEYLSKPVGMKQLIETIETLLIK